MATKPKAGTAVTKAKVNMPVSAEQQSRMMAMIQQQAEQTPVSSSIKIKLENTPRGFMFTFPNKTQVSEFNGIVVAFAASQVYRERTDYVKDVDNPILCAATAPKMEMLEPFDTVEKPFAASCATCAHSKFTKDAKGTSVKPRCGLRAVLAVVPENASTTSEMLILDVPVQSAKAFFKYLPSTIVSDGRPVQGVLTKFTFDQNVTYVSPVYESLGPTDPDTFDMVADRYEEGARLVLTPPIIGAETKEEPGSKAPGSKAPALKAPRKKAA